jgi:hypothetical protein
MDTHCHWLIQRNSTYNREGIPMSLCFSGLQTPCRAYPVTVDISSTHPLMKLAQVIPWPALAELVLPDLKRTTAKGQWWRGRKLKEGVSNLLIPCQRRRPNS